MSNLNLAVMQWSDVKDIDDTQPVNEDDSECLFAIRDVLKKFGMQDRFGVALLHSHLDLADDEVFLEECDDENRVLHLKPTKVAEAANGQNIGTIFHLRDGKSIEETMYCNAYCHKGVFGHSKRHEKPAWGPELVTPISDG
jgi:hypothetical protein